MRTYGCPDHEIADAICKRVSKPIEIDGRLDKAPWTKAVKSPRFVDMVTGEPGLYDTRAAALWDDQNLYVAFWVEEPFVRARATERDSYIFLEKDVEVFIDGGDCYYEFEVNALGTIYEVFYIWRDAFTAHPERYLPEFDPVKRNALVFGGDWDRTGVDFWKGRHPRGLRWAYRDWDFPGVKCAVRVDGRINDDSVVDRGWTVELAFPWAGMKTLTHGRTLPPQDGDVWRILFGRFHLMSPSGIEVQPHPGWLWNRHGVYDTHLPECFTRVHFSKETV